MTGSFMGSLRERDASANGGATTLCRFHIFYSVNTTLMSDSRPRFLHEPTWPFMNEYFFFLLHYRAPEGTEPYVARVHL